MRIGPSLGLREDDGETDADGETEGLTEEEGEPVAAGANERQTIVSWFGPVLYVLPTFIAPVETVPLLSNNLPLLYTVSPPLRVDAVTAPVGALSTGEPVCTTQQLEATTVSEAVISPAPAR